VRERRGERRGEKRLEGVRGEVGGEGGRTRGRIKEGEGEHFSQIQKSTSLQKFLLAPSSSPLNV
jgi:hypothetical protein